MAADADRVRLAVFGVLWLALLAWSAWRWAPGYEAGWTAVAGGLLVLLGEVLQDRPRARLDS